jgi:hypothetical protein
MPSWTSVSVAKHGKQTCIKALAKLGKRSDSSVFEGCKGCIRNESTHDSMSTRTTSRRSENAKKESQKMFWHDTSACIAYRFIEFNACV